MSKEGRERREQRRCRGEVTTRGAMVKCRYVRIIERKEVRRDDPIKCSSPLGSEVPFESHRG